MKNIDRKIILILIAVASVFAASTGFLFIPLVLGTGAGGGGDGGGGVDGGSEYPYPSCDSNDLINGDGAGGIECNTGKSFTYSVSCSYVYGSGDPNKYKCTYTKVYSFSNYYSGDKYPQKCFDRELDAVGTLQCQLAKPTDECTQGTCDYIGGVATCVYNKIPNCPAAPAPPSPPPTTTTTPPAVSPTPPPPCDPDTCTGTCLDVDGDGVTECVNTTAICGNGIVESGEECDPPLSTVSCTVNNKLGIKTCGNDCKFTDGGKCTEVSDAPQLSDFKSFGNPNYLNVFWKASYPSVSRQLTVECYLNCDPQKENCSTAQKCEPFPYLQQPGSGSCTVENPKYLTSKDNSVTCKAYDPSNPSLANWY